MDNFKFRVWDNEDNKYLELGFEQEEDRYNKGQAMPHHGLDGLFFTLSGYRDDDNNPYELDCDIELCSSLPDKNGKLIYEGDIILDAMTNYVVKFNPLNGFIKVPVGQKDEYYSGLHNHSLYEVIGNIHANPELTPQIMA